MGLDQKIENVLGRLAILVPSMEKYQEKVDSLITKSAVFDTRLVTVEKKVNDLTPSVKEKRNRMWDVFMLLFSNLLGQGIGFTLAWKLVVRTVNP